jgi:hypothetical protein
MKTLPLLMLLVLLAACTKTGTEQPKEPPTPKAKGVLVSQVPSEADLIVPSIRYILEDLACLDKNYNVKNRFVHDPDCNPLMYKSSGLGSPKQLYYMDLDHPDCEQNNCPMVQITNMDCFFDSGTPFPDRKRIMTLAICSDTNGDGILYDGDESNLYILNLETEELKQITSGINLNNPDLRSDGQKIVFSGAEQGLKFRVYTMNPDGTGLTALTNDDNYMDFDTAWSPDGSMISFSRVIQQDFPLTIPSGVWVMNSDGTGLKQLTSGGPNPEGKTQGAYAIGIDADPELSPDNSKVVFSRLMDDESNGRFGVYTLHVVDVDNPGNIKILSPPATGDFIPEWSERGICVISMAWRGEDPMDAYHGLILIDPETGSRTELETFPNTVYPLGAYGCKFIS